MTEERRYLLNPWFADEPKDPPQTDTGSKGDRDKPVKPKKKS